MFAKELKAACGRKPGKEKDVATPHCIYDTDFFLMGPIEEKDMLSKLTIELPDSYNPPSVEDCINDYNLPKKAELIKAVNASSESIIKDSAAAGFNREAVKSLSLYTFDYKPPSKSFIGSVIGGKDANKDTSEESNTARERINDLLKERNPFTVVKGRGYLVSFLASLRKLQHIEKFAFYFGVKEKLTNTTKFKYGSLLSCKTFLSCSTNPDSIKEMLNYTGTLFIIRGDPWAYDIRPFSFYPNEQEYIFEFGSQFKVTKFITGPMNTIEMALNKVQNYDLTSLVPIPGYTFTPSDAPKPSPPQQKQQATPASNTEQKAQVSQNVQQQQQQQPQVQQVKTQQQQQPQVKAQVQQVKTQQPQTQSPPQVYQQPQNVQQKQQQYQPRQQHPQNQQSYLNCVQQGIPNNITSMGNFAAYATNVGQGFVGLAKGNSGRPTPKQRPAPVPPASAPKIPPPSNGQMNYGQQQQQQQQQQRQNNLIPTNSIMKIQQKVIPRPSLSVRRDGVTISSRISEAAAKIRDPSLSSYLEGCNELNAIILENNNKSTKEICMSIKVIESIVAALVKKARDKEIFLSSFGILSLLSDEAANELVNRGYIQTLASLINFQLNDVGICALWCSILLNVFKHSPSFHDSVINPSNGEENFTSIKTILERHSQDPQICDIVGSIIVEFSKDGYFCPARSGLNSSLVSTLLASLHADMTLSHSVCPAIEVLIHRSGVALDKNSCSLLVSVIQTRIGFLGDLLPALTILLRISDLKNPAFIGSASELGLTQLVVSLMQKYAEDSAVVETCLALSLNLVTNNASLVGEFIQSGFVELTVNAIRKHGQTVPAICICGLDSLLVLSMSPAAIQSFVAANGTPLLFEVVRSPMASDHIMQDVWGICSWIASSDGSVVFKASGGGDVILGLFEKYMRDQTATERGSVTLMYLVQSCPEMAKSITTPQAIALFATVLNTYIENQTICAQLSFLFSKIADVLNGSGLDNCIYPLISVIYKHGGNQSIVEHVCATLKRVALSNNRSMNNSSLSGSSWGSGLGGLLEKNFSSLDICRPIINTLETLTRTQDATNCRALLVYVRALVVIFGNNAADISIAQCASGVLKNIIPVENALNVLAGTSETIPAISAVLGANGKDKIVFSNCSFILRVLTDNVPQVCQAFVQSSCAPVFYNLYVMYQTSDPATASEGSWIEKYVRR